MKKLIFVVLLVAIVVGMASALEFKVGPKITAGDYSFRGSDWKADKNAFNFNDQLSFSFSGGVFANIQFTSLIGLQAEGLFTVASFRYGDDTSWAQLTTTAVSFPVYVRFNFDLGNVGLYLLAGPRIDFFFDAYEWKTSVGTNGTGSLTDDYGYESLTNIGAGLGAGVMVPVGSGSLDIGMGLNTGLNRMDDDYIQYPIAVDLQIGYGFGF